MFAGEHKLDNLVLIIDNNKICMLDYCKNILDIEPLDEKFKTFKWAVDIVEGHDIAKVYASLIELKEDSGGRPKVLIANTIKGKGVLSLETDPMSHIKNIMPGDIDAVIEGLK